MHKKHKPAFKNLEEHEKASKNQRFDDKVIKICFKNSTFASQFKNHNIVINH